MKKKLTKKDQIFISGIVVILLFVALYFIFIAQPLLKKILDCSKEEERIKTQLKNAEQFARDKEKLAKEVEDIQDKINFYEERLPKKTDIPKVLDELIKIGKKSKITFVSLEPQAINKIQVGQSEKVYLRMPMELKLKAKYHNFASFVNDVENLDHFMRVDDVKIVADKDHGSMHDISLTVSAYALEEKQSDVLDR